MEFVEIFLLTLCRSRSERDELLQLLQRMTAEVKSKDGQDSRHQKVCCFCESFFYRELTQGD